MFAVVHRVCPCSRNVATKIGSIVPRDGPEAEGEAGPVANARAILRQVLARGVELGVLGTNPVARVKPPRPQRTDAPALTPAEARRLIAAAAPDRLGAAVALLFVQGWRVSEVLGLAWTDLDLEAGTATIRREVEGRRVAGRWCVDWRSARWWTHEQERHDPVPAT